MNNGDFQLRPAQPDDFQAVFALIIAHDVAVLGFPDYTEDDLHADWEKPRFDLATDAWVATTAQGRLVGYGEVWWREPHVRISSDFYARPGLGEPGPVVDAEGKVLGEHRGIARGGPLRRAALCPGPAPLAQQAGKRESSGIR